MNKEQEKHTEEILKGIEKQMLQDLPIKIQTLRPDMQADINRVAQKTIQGMRNIGRVSPEKMQETINEVTKMQANLTEKYGTDGNK